MSTYFCPASYTNEFYLLSGIIDGKIKLRRSNVCYLDLLKTYFVAGGLPEVNYRMIECCQMTQHTNDGNSIIHF